MRSARWLVVLVASCGRLGFDPVGDAASAGVDAAGLDGATQANRAFVTSAQLVGNLGGLAGADALCTNAASAAGLDGTFVAWLSTTTVDAIDRLAGSRGWVRTDGTALADQPAQIASGELFVPLDLDENGHPAPLPAEPWTGTNPDGRAASGLSCGDWTGAGTGQQGVAAAGMPSFTDGGTIPCMATRSLYCFELGQVTPVAPVVTAGRIAFVSISTYAGGGLSQLDAACNADAAAAGLLGSYLAAVATTTASPASRFVADVRPWRRVDGQLVAADNATLFGGTLTAFIDQRADGVYLADPVVLDGTSVGPSSAGTMASTCTDWSDVVTANAAIAGRMYFLDGLDFWNGQPGSCNVPTPLLCLQM